MPNQYINALTQTWGNVGTVFTAIKMTVTNSASAAGSKLIDLIIGSTSMFSVDKNGHVSAAGNLLLASASKLDFASGNVTMTHATGTMTWAGVSAYTVRYTDAAAAIGPNFILDRLSASPAAADIIGGVTLRGRDSGGNNADYGVMKGRIVTPTDGSEVGGIDFDILNAGSAYTVLSLDVGAMQLASTDAGAGAGPQLALYRNSASPAAADQLGWIRFLGKDSAANIKSYADIYASILDATSGSEDSQMNLRVALAGALVDLLTLYSTGSVTAAAINGVLKLTRNTTMTISSGGSISINGSYHSVDTFAAAATDNLDDIYLAGGTTPEDGMIVTLMPVSNARNVIIRHNVGASTNSNILTTSAANVTLDTSAKTASFIYRVSAGWVQTGGKIT